MNYDATILKNIIDVTEQTNPLKRINKIRNYPHKRNNTDINFIIRIRK